MFSNRRFFLAVLLGIALFSFDSVAQPSQSGAEPYRIYDAVLDRMFAGGKVNFDSQAKVDPLVIREQTINEFAYSEKKENWEQVKIRLPDLSDETIADFEANISKVTKLRRTFNLQLKYVLFPQKDFTSIFGDSRNYNSTDENWKKFHQMFPKSSGYVMLSNVGFDKSKTQALVYFVHWCGTLCGSGHYVLVKKNPEKWDVSGIGGIWIS